MGAELIVSPGEFLSTSENAAPSLELLPQLPSRGWLGVPGQGGLCQPAAPRAQAAVGTRRAWLVGVGTPHGCPGLSSSPTPAPAGREGRGGEGRQSCSRVPVPACTPSTPWGARAEPPTLQAPLPPTLPPFFPRPSRAELQPFLRFPRPKLSRPPLLLSSSPTLLAELFL